ncbi:hypothetical protein DAMA08_047410 [Martiniozyma asiatica (nom. inval.)]|nr:hypothetical protein DAMA08_047410 [Martiniozyma asiatica]
MIRNVPHLHQTSKITLQSCLTINNVFQTPYNHGHDAQKRRQIHYSAPSYNYGKQKSLKPSNNIFPSLKDITKNVAKNNLPYYKQLLAFDECLAHNSFFDQQSGDIPGGTTQFWSAINKIMILYEDLIITGELNEKRSDELISLLRNGLRMHRFELAKLKKNVDRDVNSPLQQIYDHLKKSILRISQDLISQNSAIQLKISPRGLTHLFKAYTDMGLADEAALLWHEGKKISELYPLFTAENVLGSIVSLLVENKNFDFNEIWAIYATVKNSKKEKEIVHAELQLAMVRACLSKGKTEQALSIFKEITTGTLEYYDKKNIAPSKALKNYMSMAHLSFIGYCQDYETANVFFLGSFGNDMPYLTPIQLNYVKKFMINTWNSTGDFEKITEIWKSTWQYFENNKKSTNAISSSLNDAYLEVFFIKYKEFNNESAIALSNLLETYSNMKSMDEPFFNCLITKSKIWKNLTVFESIIQAADMYNFSKTNVFHRCVLKASGSVNLPIERSLYFFERLLSCNVQNGSNYITNADWFALRDATIHSLELSSDKVDTYFKLFKICCPHFLGMKNFKLYMDLDCGLDRRYRHVFEQMDMIETNDVQLPQLQWFAINESIVNYWASRGVDITAYRMGYQKMQSLAQGQVPFNDFMAPNIMG